MTQFFGFIKFLGMSWSGGGLLSAICIFMILLDERSLTNGDCMVRPPHKSHTFDVFIRKFWWDPPKDNIGGDKRFVPEGQSVTFFCENGFVDSRFSGKIYKFLCIGGKYNGTFLYEDLFCRSDYHKNTKIYLISNIQLGSDLFKCEGRNREVYQVGTKQPDGKIRPLYKICYDANIRKTKFTYQPRTALEYIEESEIRKDVWGFDYFGNSAWERIRLSEGYVANIQTYRIGSQYPKKYSRENPFPYSFTRGHLTTFGHLFTPEDRKTTCLYLNLAPQLNELNRYTWTYIEHDIKEIILKDPTAWEIYTGVYGNLLTARGTTLFLSPLFDEKGKLLSTNIPVPKLFWKFVQNVKNEKFSRVYVGVNNPEFRSEKDITPDYMICKPISRGGAKIRGTVHTGFAYECNVKEFLAKLSTEEKIIKD